MIWIFKSIWSVVGLRSFYEKKNKYYEFVPKHIYGPYLNRAFTLVQRVIKTLNSQGIHSKCYLIGSAGKRHMITRLVINGIPKPFDVDINIEINLETLPKKYQNLKLRTHSSRTK